MADGTLTPPMSPRQATEAIRSKCGPDLTLSLTTHAREQMDRRGLIVGDVLHVMRVGFVYDEGEPSTRPGLYKYRMESVTPNSNGRTVRIVVIPSNTCAVKIVTVMWKDEH